MADFFSCGNASGVGNGSFKLTPTVNSTDNEKQGTVTVTSAKGVTATVKVRQYGKEVVVLPDCDYIVMTYNFDSAAGADYDSATKFSNTGQTGVDNVWCGFSKASNPTTQATIGTPTNPMLMWGGDNQSNNGGESACLFIKNLIDTYGSSLPETIMAQIKGNWFISKGTGDIHVCFTCYKGGTMSVSASDHIWTNTGGTKVLDSACLSTNVSATGQDNYVDINNLYSSVATFNYNRTTKGGTIVLS